MVATSTLDASVAEAMRQFAEVLNEVVIDATAIFRTIHGVSDGNNYGRYFAGQNPLVPFIPAATSIADMIMKGVQQRQVATFLISRAVNAATDVPETFGGAVFQAVDAVRQACADPADAVRILKSLTDFDAAIDGGADAMGLLITALGDNASVLMRRASAVSLSRATATYVPPSQGDALTVRDQVADAIDDIALEAADLYQDQSYTALNDIRVAVVEDLNARGASLPGVVTKTFNAQLPALVLAYRLYQDAGRAGELVARNNPPHPSWMPIEVEALAS